MTGKKIFTLGSHAETDKIISAMKKKGPTKKLQMNIDADLHQRFKMTCMKKNLEMTTVIEDFIIEWLSENE
ncbi:plasmid partition protein ParG [Aeromonas salmonicida]|uniref:plasmid partition protein ParG n=1 Tax=Aeromonas salmonicida TaxID=645 RepID=UPI000B403231|nr:plasmid partition protein ParG [Aeromonas salmonicida]ARW85360.1 hypothetical protein O23A_P3p0061 [Aeromonas salmonicida]